MTGGPHLSVRGEEGKREGKGGAGWAGFGPQERKRNGGEGRGNGPVRKEIAGGPSRDGKEENERERRKQIRKELFLTEKIK
jgi:hypothetical protein